jgi:hypothetical protein
VRWHLGKEVGVVGEEEAGRSRGNRAQGARDVVRALPEVADANQPEPTGTLLDVLCLVLEQRNALVLERPGDPVGIEPPVVVAEHREYAGRCTELRQHRRRLLGRDEVAAHHAVYDVIAREQHQVGPGLLGERDDLAELLEPVEGGAHVDVREHGHPETRTRLGPPGEVECQGLVAQTAGLEPEAPERQREGQAQEQNGDGEELHGVASGKSSWRWRIRKRQSANTPPTTNRLAPRQQAPMTMYTNCALKSVESPRRSVKKTAAASPAPAYMADQSAPIARAWIVEPPSRGSTIPASSPCRYGR